MLFYYRLSWKLWFYNLLYDWILHINPRIMEKPDSDNRNLVTLFAISPKRIMQKNNTYGAHLRILCKKV